MVYTIIEDNKQVKPFAVFARVPMNNLPGCCLFFWQQVCPWRSRKGYAIRDLKKKTGQK